MELDCKQNEIGTDLCQDKKLHTKAHFLVNWKNINMMHKNQNQIECVFLPFL